MSVLVCNVCEQNEAAGVASSPLGAISFAYCTKCLEHGAEPLHMWHTTIWICGDPENVSEDFREWACSVHDNEYIRWDRIVELYNPEEFAEAEASYAIQESETREMDVGE